jgi:hypothetical protein
MTNWFGPATIAPGTGGYGPHYLMANGRCTFAFRETAGVACTVSITDKDSIKVNNNVAAMGLGLIRVADPREFSVVGNGAILVIQATDRDSEPDPGSLSAVSVTGTAAVNLVEVVGTPPTTPGYLNTDIGATNPNPLLPAAVMQEIGSVQMVAVSIQDPPKVSSPVHGVPSVPTVQET